MSDPVDVKPVTQLPAKTGRGIKIALFVSLAVNVMIAGLVVGAMSHRWRDRDMMQGPALADLGFGPYIAALEEDDRKALVREVLGNAKDFRKNREEIRTGIESLLVLLRAPTFDPTAFAANLKAQSLKLEERRALGIDLFVKRVTEMTPEARAALADRLSRFLRRP
jgi:uncharacterized membrane protein